MSIHKLEGSIGDSTCSYGHLIMLLYTSFIGVVHLVLLRKLLMTTFAQII